MLSQWIYIHADENGANVASTLNQVIELEGISSLVHQVQPGPDALNSIDIMGWGAGILNNTVTVRSAFKMIYSLYGVYAIMQGPMTIVSTCYAATMSSLGVISLWKASIFEILNGLRNPLRTFQGPVPNDDSWGIELGTAYDFGANVMQLSVQTTPGAVTLPLVEGPGQFPAIVPRMILLDEQPISNGVNAGIFSAQLGLFPTGATLDDFDVTQIFTN